MQPYPFCTTLFYQNFCIKTGEAGSLDIAQHWIYDRIINGTIQMLKTIVPISTCSLLMPFCISNTF